MPIISEVRKAKEIGKSKGIFCWLPCDICGELRWAETYGGVPRRTICHSCSVKASNKIRQRFPPYIHGDNPQIGDIARASEIGHANSTSRYIYSACTICGKGRWVLLSRGQSLYQRCLQCSLGTPEHRANISAILKGRYVGNKSNKWKGGVRKSPNGYVEIWVSSEDFFAPMANKNHYCAEHRLVIAKHLNRCLLPWEIVHHKNGIKNDNRIENLQLLPTAKYHTVDCITKSKISLLLSRIKTLEVLLKTNNIPIPRWNTQHNNSNGGNKCV